MKIYINRKLFILMFGVLYTQVSFGQENYLSGYVVKLNGDTINGTIDYRNWARNPEKISFIAEVNSKSIIYLPMDIKAFGVFDETYLSAIVNTEVSPRKTNDLDSYSNLNIKKDTLFLQTIIKGEVGLYYDNNSSGSENFFIETDGKIKLLIYKRYISKLYIKENKKYIGQLALYLQDCPAIQSKLSDISYDRKSLEKLFLFYYNCTNKKIGFYKEKEKILIEAGILAGVSNTSIDFESEAFDYLVKAEYSSSVNFTGGLFMDIIFPRAQRKWSIYNELIYTSYSVSGFYKDVEYENSYIFTISSTEIGVSYLKLNNMVRFKYPIGNSFIYLNAGISNGIAIGETNVRIKETNTKTEIVKAMEATRKYEQGIIVGIGGKYKKYSIEARFENGNGMSEYVSLKSTTNRFYFILGFRL